MFSLSLSLDGRYLTQWPRGFISKNLCCLSRRLLRVRIYTLPTESASPYTHTHVHTHQGFSYTCMLDLYIKTPCWNRLFGKFQMIAEKTHICAIAFCIMCSYDESSRRRTAHMVEWDTEYNDNNNDSIYRKFIYIQYMYEGALRDENDEVMGAQSGS